MCAVQLYLALLQERRAGRCAGQRVRLVRLVVMGHQPTLGTHTLTVVACIVGCPALRHAPAQAFQLTYGYQHSATTGVLLDGLGKLGRTV